MNIFFGKISPKQNPEQIVNGYYETGRPQMFNGIDIGDYCYSISGSNIQLWQAKSWENNNQRLNFEIIHNNLGIKTNKLMALKFFKLSTDLVVLTVRQSQIAFYKIDTTISIDEPEIENIDTYRNSENFRNIVVYNSADRIDKNSINIQLYYENKRLKIWKPNFLKDDFFDKFYDNINKIGKGRRKKDRTLKLIQNVNEFPKVFKPTELSLLSLYDAFGVLYEKAEIEEDETLQDETNKDLSNQHSLNQILFGPPGTGKTYYTVNHAIAIIEEKTLEQIEEEYQHRRKDLIKRFEAYRDNKQIRFITFHQSFTYEDFVEGIKPRTIDDENEKKVIYEIEDGVFKEIVNDAKSISKLSTNPERNNLLLSEDVLNKINFFKTSLGNTYSSEDDMIYDYCKANSVIAVGWGDNIDFTDSKTEQDVIDKFLSIDGYKSTDYAIIAIKCLKFWMKKDDIVFISNGNKRVRAIGQISGDYFFKVDSEIRYNQFRPVKWLATDLDLPVDVIYERNFSQQTIYMMYKNLIKKSFFSSIKEEKDTNTSKNHVLIIDEINRGNVSQIFGELITLLEEDKRENAEMPMKITLPYSKQEFSVPSNLYIIGTMNTADRSVEALDTALRRRFSFEEMPPKYDLEELNYTVTENIKATDILAKINLRLENLLDKDHLIGHSFFICKEGESPLEKVKETFYKNIIPLLQEYFYGDYGKIGLVLGKKFVRKKESSEQSVFAEFEGYESNFNERNIFEIIDYRNTNEADTFENALKILMR